MNLIETEIDGELFRRGRQRLAKQPVRKCMVVAIGGDPFLKQRVDLIREVAEIDRARVREQVRHAKSVMQFPEVIPERFAPSLFI
jgi:hypothetical protein